MVRSALLVSLEATSTLVAGKAIPMTMRKGMMVQMTSTVTDSWKLAALWPSDLRCFQMEKNITLKTEMKITMQVMSMNQCSHACSAAMRVAAGWRLSWRTAGPPGRSLTAWAAGLSAPRASNSEANLLEMLFMVLLSLASNKTR